MAELTKKKLANKPLFDGLVWQLSPYFTGLIRQITSSYYLYDLFISEVHPKGVPPPLVEMILEQVVMLPLAITTPTLVLASGL